MYHERYQMIRTVSRTVPDKGISSLLVRGRWQTVGPQDFSEPNDQVYQTLTFDQKKNLELALEQFKCCGADRLDIPAMDAWAFEL